MNESLVAGATARLPRNAHLLFSDSAIWRTSSIESGPPLALIASPSRATRVAAPPTSRTRTWSLVAAFVFPQNSRSPEPFHAASLNVLSQMVPGRMEACPSR
jgi:hypothetical protein